MVTTSKSHGQKQLSIWACCAAMIVVTGVIDGHYSQRWDSSNQLANASLALNNLPLKIEDWIGTDTEISPQHLKTAGATGSISRSYTNRKSGEQIQVMVLCGPHGPIALHPPTVCFLSAGWQLKSPPQKNNIKRPNEDSCSFWQAKFSHTQQRREQVILTDWAWNNGDGWTAATNPRFDYAGSPYLFKLYVTSSPSPTTDAGRARREKFVAILLDEFEHTVFESLTDLKTAD